MGKAKRNRILLILFLASLSFSHYLPPFTLFSLLSSLVFTPRWVPVSSLSTSSPSSLQPSTGELTHAGHFNLGYPSRQLSLCSQGNGVDFINLTFSLFTLGLCGFVVFLLSSTGSCVAWVSVGVGCVWVMITSLCTSFTTCELRGWTKWLVWSFPVLRLFHLWTGSPGLWHL